MKMKEAISYHKNSQNVHSNFFEVVFDRKETFDRGMNEKFVILSLGLSKNVLQ